MTLDLPDRHAARVHQHDLVVEAGKAPLIALNQIECSLGERLPPLVGDGQIGFGLPPGRDAARRPASVCSALMTAGMALTPLGLLQGRTLRRL